jgi:Flp pilus assembly protein TadB
MIDAIRLLIWGVCAATLAWGLWHWLGEQTVGVLSVAAVISLLVENRRLRRNLRARQSAPGSASRIAPRRNSGPSSP